MADSTPYRVLARKYRPTVLSELVGQDVLVRTLSNAFQSGRIHHAFLLTGVRGIGKTTSARIIARALNCTGPDGKGGPTINPCGVCDNCRAIADDRHVDVIEMDAATHTGVDDVRALTEGARYAPVAGRAKVFILDEVHMLSKQAFAALLKTLEEPPPHVTFIFATTESRKVPLTILSRCQRFDLRRLEPDVMAQHLGNVAKKENVPVEQGALALLARAADGSVRDGLSILDQAIALAQGAAGGTVTEQLVQEMLGLADRNRTLDLFDALLAGDVAGALGNLREQYELGADPVLVLQDLLDLVHWLTRLKAVPSSTDLNARTAAEQERGKTIAAKVPMPVLARSWQMLLKGLEEAGIAPDPMAAVEMVLVRVAYVADLPTPAEVVEKLQSAPASAEMTARTRSAPAPAVAALAPRPEAPNAAQPVPPWATTSSRSGAEPARAEATVPLAAAPKPGPTAQAAPALLSFEDVVRLTGDRGEPRLCAELINGVHLVAFETGRIEMRLHQTAQKDLANRLSKRLQEWTGRPWAIALSNTAGAPTLAEQQAAERANRLAEAKTDPAVQAVLAAFPGAEIREVRDLAPPAPADVPHPEIPDLEPDDS